ncbi:hypothetical protein V7138_06995 [Bacillus sp. JJ1533]
MSKNNNESQNRIEFSIWDTNTERSHSIPASKTSETPKKNTSRYSKNEE